MILVFALKRLILPALLVAGGASILLVWADARQANLSTQGTILYVDGSSELTRSDGYQTDIHWIAADSSEWGQVTYSMDTKDVSCSADGRWVYYSTREDTGEWRIYRDDSNGQAECLTDEIEGDAQSPAVSPDGNRLAFECVRDEGSTICLLDLESMEDVTTGDGMENLDPAWSPDGRFLAYVERDHEGSALVLRDAETLDTVASMRASAGSEYSLPSFSPDGSQFSVTIGNGDGFDIWIGDMNSLLSGEGKIVDGGWLDSDYEDVSAYRWSPDGTQVACLARDTEEWRLATRVLDGGEWREVSELTASSASWLPDSQSLAAGFMNRGCFELGVCDISSGDVEFKQSNHRWLYNPVASDNGETLAYDVVRWSRLRDGWRRTTGISWRDGSTRMLEPQGVDDSDCGNPSVVPDGSMVAFVEYNKGDAKSRIRSVESSSDDVVDLVKVNGWRAAPDVSQGREVVVCRSWGDGVDCVTSYEVEDGTERDLTENGAPVGVFALSRCGRYLAFTSDRMGRVLQRGSSRRYPSDVYVKGFWPDDSAVRLEIPELVQADATDLAWSPNGRSLVIEATTWDEDGDEHYDLYLVDLKLPLLPILGEPSVRETRWLVRGQDPYWIADMIDGERVVAQ